jgi:hypothetical protein
VKTLTRDLAAVGGLVAAVIVSLVIVRVTASDPPITTASPTTAAGGSTPLPAATTVTPSSSTTTSESPVLTSLNPPAAQQPMATLVLSSGEPVDPRLDRTPRTARPAATPPATVTVTPPPNDPDSWVFQDPASVATAWLSALCWYDYREVRENNTRRAAVYGDTQMPEGKDPWTLDEQAWSQITATQTGSACIAVTASVETLKRNDTDQTIVTVTGTQVLSTAGTPYQSAPVAFTRVLQRDPAGRWLIGRAVTAN